MVLSLGRMSRRSLLAGLAAAPLLAAELDVLLGAIRWDAWYGPGSVPTTAVERSLSPRQWQRRVPFFVAATAAGVVVPPPDRDELRVEMRQARAAGLDYWAFCGFPPGNPMGWALETYLGLDDVGPRFCLITGSDPTGLADYHAERLAHPKYQRLVDGRPLFFLLLSDLKAAMRNWGGADAWRTRMDQFRALVAAKAGREPCIVLMGNPDETPEVAREIHADGLGAYAIPGPRPGGPYSGLASAVAERWNVFERTGLPYVPLAMAGWDRRPRVEHPVPWEAGQRPGVGIDAFYAAGRPGEFAAHLRQALGRARQQPFRTALIYAWDENDEGGYLVPTLGCDGDLLLEVARVRGGLLSPSGLCDRR